MHTFSDPSTLAECLLKIFESEDIALIAGAGISARAGLPVWHGYLDLLAKIADRFEPYVGGLIRKRAASNLLVQAADAYTTSVEIPDGLRWSGMTEPFKAYDATALRGLAQLPFDFIVTTNYDRALHDALVLVRKTSKTAELHDPSLRQAVYWEEMFIARIHGRVEVPQSIILDSNSYRQLETNQDYADFLHRTLTRKSCLFMGFSFADPAIDKILDFYASKGVYPRQHYAVIPISKDPLAARMSKFNIEILQYDDKEHHSVLWNSVEIVNERFRPEGQKKCPLPLFETARRLLAVCYARASMGSEGVALRHLVVQGIVLSALDSGLASVAGLIDELRSYLAIDVKEGGALVNDALAALAERGMVLRDGDDVILVKKLAEIKASSPAEEIASGIVNRLAVRSNLEVPEDVRLAILRVTEHVIILRGFDLGAEFAGARDASELDATLTIQTAIEKYLPDYRADRKQLICQAFVDLLRRPEPTEERALSEVGRLAFGIEVVLQSGRSTMYALSLPEVVYLDASVLMPAIMPGHPFRRAYTDAIRKLQTAAQRGGMPTRVAVADVFLEETIKHRQRAIDVVRELKLESLEAIRRPITYYGVTEVNVFVGAYSSWLVTRAKGEDTSFETFLNIVAPYSTEAELAKYIEPSGIEIVKTAEATDIEVLEYSDSLDRLLDGYEAASTDNPRIRGKATVLKKHEARQLTLLEKDVATNVRSVFFTADSGLRAAVAKGDFHGLEQILLSNRNLVQLVDLLIGIELDSGALARLLWTVQIADERAALKEYLINRALQQYDTALLLRMNEIIDGYVERTARDAKLEGVDLLAIGSHGRVRTTRFLDRAEQYLFSELANELRKQKAESQPH